jgi:Fe-S oxidoreductase
MHQLQSDYSICTKCKICQAVHVQYCDDSRFWRNCPSGTRFRWDAYYASGKMEIARGLHTGEIDPNESMRHVLYSCLLCSSCQEQCYEVKQLHPTRLFELMRERAVLDGWGPMPEHAVLAESLEQNDNPWGLSKTERGDWAAGLELKDLNTGSAETLFFAGCTYAADPRLRPAARAAAKLLQMAGLDTGTFGAEELCCGAPMLMLGDRDYFETFAAENVARINASGVKRIVAACAHCAWVMKEEYGQELNADIEVKHLSEVLWRPVLKQGLLKPEREVSMRAVFHDPCKLGRRFDIYDQPRKVLAAIPGLELAEMPRSTFNSLCCGGGGGVPYAFPDYALWVAKERLAEAEYAGAEAIITSCPYCVQMLEKAVADQGSDIKVFDLPEVLLRSLGEEV